MTTSRTLRLLVVSALATLSGLGTCPRGFAAADRRKMATRICAAGAAAADRTT